MAYFVRNKISYKQNNLNENTAYKKIHKRNKIIWNIPTTI